MGQGYVDGKTDEIPWYDSVGFRLIGPWWLAPFPPSTKTQGLPSVLRRNWISLSSDPTLYCKLFVVYWSFLPQNLLLACSDPCYLCHPCCCCFCFCLWCVCFIVLSIAGWERPGASGANKWAFQSLMLRKLQETEENTSNVTQHRITLAARVTCRDLVKAIPFWAKKTWVEERHTVGASWLRPYGKGRSFTDSQLAFSNSLKNSLFSDLFQGRGSCWLIQM